MTRLALEGEHMKRLTGRVDVAVVCVIVLAAMMFIIPLLSELSR